MFVGGRLRPTRVPSPVFMVQDLFEVADAPGHSYERSLSVVVYQDNPRSCHESNATTMPNPRVGIPSTSHFNPHPGEIGRLDREFEMEASRVGETPWVEVYSARVARGQDRFSVIGESDSPCVKFIGRLTTRRDGI